MSAPSLPSDRYANYVLGTMFVLTALNVMDRQVLAVLVEPVKNEFGLSDAEMGLLTGSAFALAHVVAMVPVGRLADVGHRRNVIAIGLFLWSALTVLTGASRVYWHLFLTRVGVGASETVGSGPAQSLLSDYFSVARRGMALSVHASGGTFGAMAGFALGGLLADAVGWRLTFVCFGIPGLLLTLLLLLTVREPARGAVDGLSESVDGSSSGGEGAIAGERGGEDDSSLWSVLRYLLGLRTYRQLLIAGALNAFANWSLLAWATAAMMRGHALSATEAGARIASSVTLFSAAGLIAAGLLSDRLGRTDIRWYMWLPAVASMLAYPFLLAFLLLPDPDLAFWVVIPGAFLNTMWVGTFNASIQLLARPRMRATANSFFVLLTTGLIGQGLGPVFVGVLSDWLEPAYGVDALRYALAVAVATSVWAALHSVLGTRTLRQERASPG